MVRERTCLGLIWWSSSPRAGRNWSCRKSLRSRHDTGQYRYPHPPWVADAPLGETPQVVLWCANRIGSIPSISNRHRSTRDPPPVFLRSVPRWERSESACGMPRAVPPGRRSREGCPPKQAQGSGRFRWCRIAATAGRCAPGSQAGCPAGLALGLDRVYALDLLHLVGPAADASHQSQAAAAGV